jgi:hypothetical protein
MLVGEASIRVQRFTAQIGLAAVGSAFTLFVVRTLLHRVDAGFPGSVWDAVLSPLRKLPPSPAYFLFYGGCGAFGLSVLMWLHDSPAVRLYSRCASLLGRTSLFVFILQYVVYFTLFSYFDPGPATLWPLFFVVSVAAIAGCALLWDRFNLNRFLIIPDMRMVFARSR